MKYVKYQIIWFIVGAAILAALFQFGAFDGCGSGGQVTGSEVDDLFANTTWRLVGLGWTEDPDVPMEDLDLEFSEIFVSGWTGCNDFVGDYSFHDDRFVLIDLVATERACPTQSLFQQEQLILGVLRTFERSEISGERLTLHTKGGQVLIFDQYTSEIRY